MARFVESSIKGTESRHQPYLSGNNITAFAQSAPPADSAALGQKFFFAKGQIWLAEFGSETGAFSQQHLLFIESCMRLNVQMKGLSSDHAMLLMSP